LAPLFWQVFSQGWAQATEPSACSVSSCRGATGVKIWSSKSV
jgi:hypothetical protein